MNRLRKLRESYQLSQQKLADQLELTQQKIHAYEAGINEPDIDTLKLLANYFDTSVDYLIENTEIRRKIEKVEPYELSGEEIEFLEKFRQLQPNLRRSLMLFIETLTHQ